MQIKRFVAEDMRQAIRKVERELGPEAVILSSKKVPGGIEIVAAMDFDAALLSKETGSLTSPAPQLPAEPRQLAKDPRVTPVAPSAAPLSQAPHRDSNYWSQEPSLMQIRAELSDLRNLLERQMSGLAWGDEARRHPARAKIIRDLAGLGLDIELSLSIANRVPDDLSAQHGWIKAIETLVSDVVVANDDVLEHGGVVALVGPTGVGKTTTIAKLAARYALRHGRKRVALVTIDNYRIGAHEQLRTYGRIMDVPVYTVKNPEEMRGTLDDLVDKDLVLIDTAGMSHRDKRIHDQFAILAAAQPNLKTCLVLAATTQFSGLTEIAQVFKGLSLQGCVLTKLDETAQLGGALSAVIAQRLPLMYLSDGQRVPEDLHVARAKNLVYRAVTLQRQTGHVTVNDESLESAFRGAAVNANV